MIHSIFKFGNRFVKRILPFGPDDEELDWEDQTAAPDVISVGVFLESFAKLPSTEPAGVVELENTVRNATVEWFKLLVARDGLVKLLNTSSSEAEKFLQNHFLNNVKFLEAVQLNSSTAQQLVQGIQECPTVRRNAYLLLISIGLFSYSGFVLLYKTCSLLQRERPSGMFQYLAEELAGVVSQPDSVLSASAQLDALIPPLSLMTALFAGDNGFFIEGLLTQQIHGSALLTSLADTVRGKFTVEKHYGRLGLPTLKEPSPKDFTPQISQAIEALQTAEKSSSDSHTLVWLQNLIAESNGSSTEPAKTSGHVEALHEYVVTLQQGDQPPPETPRCTAVPARNASESTVQLSTQQSVSTAELETADIKPEIPAETPTEPAALPVGTRPILQSPPSLISFQEFAKGEGVIVEDAVALPAVSPVPLLAEPEKNGTITVPSVVKSEPVTLPISGVPSAPVSPSATAGISAPPPPPPPPSSTSQVPTPPPLPPPTGGFVPPPPPPPPVMGLDGFMVSSKLGRSNLKPLRWTKLDAPSDVVMESVWAPKEGVPEIDMTKLEELFKIEKTKLGTGLGGSKEHLAESDVNPTSLISPQTELRINVILKQFPDINGEDLAKNIQACNVAEFDESQLKELLAALPNDQEFDQIEKLKGQFKATKPAEHFLFGLLTVDHLKLRLEIMLFLSEFPVTERSVRRNCEDIMNACKIIQSCESFRNFLLLVLNVGNKLNGSRPIGGAKAFDTNILPKLIDVPSLQPRLSLLHFLVQQLSQSSPKALNFLDELDTALDMARVPLGQMKAEILLAREKFGQLLEEIDDAPENVKKSLQKLLQGKRARLNSLTDLIMETYQRTQSLAIYLVEDPDTFQIQEYIEMLRSFLQATRSVLEHQSRHNSVSSNSSASNSSSSLSSAPMLRDPRTASVFASLRNELQTTLAFQQQNES